MQETDGKPCPVVGLCTLKIYLIYYHYKNTKSSGKVTKPSKGSSHRSLYQMTAHVRSYAYCGIRYFQECIYKDINMFGQIFKH